MIPVGVTQDWFADSSLQELDEEEEPTVGPTTEQPTELAR
jgi:hypothetical protein